MDDVSQLTHVKISIGQSKFEFSGSETFVQECIKDFKELMEHGGVNTSSDNTKNLPDISKKSNGKQKSDNSSPLKKQPKRSNKITAERFETHGSEDIKSLQEFIEEKSPGRANGEKIVVIGYYITEILQKEFFTEGQIEYAYKMLKYNRPAHLHQIMINTKNDSDWFEQNSDTTGWVLTRSGDIFVSDEMPKNAE